MELPIVIYSEFRNGNHTGGTTCILKKIFDMMPEGKRIKAVLLDSEFYANEIINFLTERNVSFAVSADKTRSLLDTIKSISELSVFKDNSGIITDRLIGESVYCLNDTEPFRIVSLKWLKKDPPLFGGIDTECIILKTPN